MGFPREEYWSGLSLPSGDLPDPGIKPTVSSLAGGFFTTEPPGEPTCCLKDLKILQFCSDGERSLASLYFDNLYGLLLNGSISYTLCGEIQGKINSTGRKAALPEGKAWLLAAKGVFGECPSSVSPNKPLRQLGILRI